MGASISIKNIMDNITSATSYPLPDNSINQNIDYNFLRLNEPFSTTTYVRQNSKSFNDRYGTNEGNAIIDTINGVSSAVNNIVENMHPLDYYSATKKSDISNSNPDHAYNNTFIPMLEDVVKNASSKVNSIVNNNNTSQRFMNKVY